MSGIDLPDEVKGIVPGKVWKRIHKNDNWYEGETVNYSIGQGYLLATPIQVVDMMAVMANKGSLVKPYLVKRIDKTDVVVERPKRIGIREDTIKVIREGIFDVVNDANGTGKRAKPEGIMAAGKTGTAQAPGGRTHAWFSGFAPYNDAKVCIVVFLEHGGKGGLDAADMAREVFLASKKFGYI